MTRPVEGSRRRAGLASLLPCLVLALVLAACTTEGGAPRVGAGDRGDGAGAVGSRSVALASAPAAVRTSFHRVHGRLPAARRKAVRRDVAAVVERWWDAAYLGGDYPRTGFRDAFPGFTAGARARARRDQRLLTNRDIGARVDAVTAERGTVLLDVLAVGGRARAVTARFVLRFTTTGRAARTTVVRGRLFLTRRHGPWRIFGYDVSKVVRA